MEEKGGLLWIEGGGVTENQGRWSRGKKRRRVRKAEFQHEAGRTQTYSKETLDRVAAGKKRR